MYRRRIWRPSSVSSAGADLNPSHDGRRDTGDRRVAFFRVSRIFRWNQSRAATVGCPDDLRGGQWLPTLNGNLFTSPAHVLVNTVGVMGKGIAREFKRVYPDMFETYRRYCEERTLTIGRMYLHKTPHKWVLNFPTKSHWRSRSRLRYIERGLRAFRQTYLEMGVRSIAFPAPGCGNGQLDYDKQVRPLMEEYLSSLSIPVFIYLPRSTTAALEHRDAMQVARWLRSVPAALHFDEVWRDLLTIIKTTATFSTLSKGASCHAELPSEANGRPELRIRAANKSYYCSDEVLLGFWQQLRDYGFVHRSIVPSHYRVSNLMPVFAELPYVDTVTVSESSRRLRSQPEVGLQVVPPATPDHGVFSPRSHAMAEA